MEGEEEPQVSSCFICGQVIIEKRGPGKRRTFAGLNDLLGKLCGLLSLKEIGDKDWDFLAPLGRHQLICCGDCYDILKNVEKIHDVILKTQKQLKVELDQVQALIVKSEEESQCLQSSLWNLTCFDFRTSVLNKVTGSYFDDEDEDNLTRAILLVKQEKEGDDEGLRRHSDNAEPDDYLHNDNPAEDNYDDDNDWDPLLEQEHHVTSPPRRRGPKRKVTPVGGSSDGGDKSDVVIKTELNYSLPACSVKITRLSPQETQCSPPKRKRKLEEEGPSDKQTIVEKEPSLSKVGSSRMAKRRAEQALQASLLEEASMDDDHGGGDSSRESNLEDDSNDKDYQQDNEEEDDNEGDGHVDREDDEGEEEEDPPPVVVPLQGGYLPKRERKKPPFFPLVVGKEDLYLYRWGTWVRKTYTHLECLAHRCTFRTKFDYYCSFQRIKNHIEANHRTRKHLRKIPHPCHLCGASFPKWQPFMAHIRAAHDAIFNNEVAEDVCEGCLQFTLHKRGRYHFFSHKNEEERALAIALKDGPARCIKPKESEMDEKDFPCLHPGCTMAFKSLRNLKRHEQLHLPFEQRTDRVLCPECGKEVLKDTFKAHMLRLHHSPDAVDNVIICQICDKRFLSRDNAKYEVHLRRHTGDKPFLCPECGVAFVSLSAVNSHRRHVHEIRRKECEWCDRVFTKEQSWRSHAQRKHPDKYVKQPYRKKLSKFYYNEQDEIRGERYGPVQMFPCELCGTLCKYRCSLKRHMADVHGIGHSPRKKPPPKGKKKMANYLHELDQERRAMDGEGSSSSSLAAPQIPSLSNFAAGAVAGGASTSSFHLGLHGIFQGGGGSFF